MDNEWISHVSWVGRQCVQGPVRRVVVASVAAAALCVVFAAAANEKPLSQVGKVVSVGGDGTVKVDTGDKVITVTTDDKTAVTIDGKESKVFDLKKGMDAVVTPERGTAAKIVATSKKPAAKSRPSTATTTSAPAKIAT